MSGRVKIAIAALMIGAISSISYAASDKRDDLGSSVAKPKIERPPGAQLIIAKFPDGGYITRISSRVLRPGMRVIVTGKGFGARSDQSLIGLYNGAETTGMLCSVNVWSDTQIIFDVPLSQTRPFPTTDNARLSIQVVKNGILTPYTLTRIRFVNGN